MALPPSFRYLPSGIYVDASLDEDGVGPNLRGKTDSDVGGVTVTVIDGRGIRSKREFLRAWADTFNFPDYFGMNWDAFADSAPDLSGLPPGDHLVIYDDFTPFAEAAPEDWAVALRIFPEVSASWQSAPRRVIVFLRGPLALAPNLPLAFSSI